MVSNEPPTTSVRLPLLRVQPGGETEVVLASGDWVRVSTHFFKRTYMCTEQEDCPLCVYFPSRSYWYLPASLAREGRCCLLELSATTCADVEQQCRFQGGVIDAGVRVKIRRRSKRAPLRLEVVEFVEHAMKIPFDLWFGPLMAIFGLPAIRPDESIDCYRERIMPQVESRLAAVAASVTL